MEEDDDGWLVACLGRKIAFLCDVYFLLANSIAVVGFAPSFMYGKHVTYYCRPARILRSS